MGEPYYELTIVVHDDFYIKTANPEKRCRPPKEPGEKDATSKVAAKNGCGRLMAKKNNLITTIQVNLVLKNEIVPIQVNVSVAFSQ